MQFSFPLPCLFFSMPTTAYFASNIFPFKDTYLVTQFMKWISELWRVVCKTRCLSFRLDCTWETSCLCTKSVLHERSWKSRGILLSFVFFVKKAKLQLQNKLWKGDFSSHSGNLESLGFPVIRKSTHLQSIDNVMAQNFWWKRRRRFFPDKFL